MPGCLKWLLRALIVFIWPCGVFAQARVTGADITGTFRDATGAVLAGATVTVTSQDTGVSRLATSDDRGAYVVAALSPGAYAIDAMLPGFAPQHRDLTLTLGQSIAVDFELAVALAEQEVVTARVPSLSTTRIEIGSVITQQQIQSLPTNGRNFIGFAALTPGVGLDRTPLQGTAGTSGLSFNGQRGRSNNITVDGLDNNDPVVGAVRATFSQEAVREFQVLTNSYSAEFGKASGGLVNIVTKSGTNTVQGSAFGFLRDKALNARNYFDRFDTLGNPISLAKPPFKQVQWGGILGGPLRKRRTFYFLTYEGTNATDSRLVTIAPAAAALLTSLGFPIELGNVPFSIDNHEALGKIDHLWTPARTLTVRGSYGNIDREALDDFGGTVARSRATVQHRKDTSVTASESDVLSSRWINELRGQYARSDQHIYSLDPACGGPCVHVDDGGPTVEVTGVASVGRHRFTPFLRLNRRVQLLDTISYFRGAHQVKAGFDVSAIAFPGDGNVLGSHLGGRYIFSPIPALGVTSSLDGLRRGIPAAYIQAYGSGQYPDEHYKDLSLFVQDEWRRGRVTLRSGLRYQRQFWQDATFTVPDVGGTTFTYGMPQDRNNLAPRLGLSYDLAGDRRTIVHGAYGVFYDNMIGIVESVGRFTTGGTSRAFVLNAPLASVAWNAPDHRLSEPGLVGLVGGTPPSVVSVPSPSLDASFTHQASAGIDRELAPDLTLAVNAVYARGFHQPSTLDYNPILPARLGPGRRPNDVPCLGAPPACVNGGIPGSSTSVLEFAPIGESWYKALTVELNKRLSRRHQFVASYTLSKAEDTATDFQTAFLPQNNGFGRNPADRAGLPLGFDPLSEKGPSTQDQRHRLVMSGVIELPWRLQASGIVNAASGRPFTPLAGADLNGDGNGGQFPPDRARRVAADESTSVGRNSGTTSGYATVDARLTRRIPLRGRASMDVMIEAFNLFNRANFIEETNQSSFVVFGTGAFPASPAPAYGRYTLTAPPRQVQLAARFMF